MNVWLDAFKRLTVIEKHLREQLIHPPANTLTAKQVHILHQLYQADNQHPSELARGIGVTPTSFTPMLDDLQRRGLISRTYDPIDRRMVIIQLTTQGRALRKDIQDAVEATNLEFVNWK